MVVTLTPNSALDVWTTVPRVRSGIKLRCAAPQFDPGGGGVNISRVLHRLGAPTVALFTAGGSIGDEIEARLDREGVPSERQHIAGHSRQSLHVLEEETGALYRFVMPGPELIAPEGEALLARLRHIARPGTMIAGSGSLPPCLGEDFWARTAALAREAGCPLLLDSAHGVKGALEQGIFVLRQNLEELRGVAGAALSWPDEAAAWSREQIALGACEIVVVTSSADGALLVTKDERVRLAPPKVEIKSAVGAGDSFMAGLCLGLPRGEPAREALRLAVATAAATLITPATELCRKEDVDRVLGQMGAAEPV
jgi:6-phosphofructokinase 2